MFRSPHFTLHHLQKRRDRLHQAAPLPVEEEEEEQPSEALRASEVDMVEPLSAQELLVKEQVMFTQRKTKAKVLHFVFQYLKPWGPGGKLNFSTYYPSKDVAARAILQWAGRHWKERVACAQEALPSSKHAPQQVF